MDPVSIGIAAVALLGTKATEEFAKQAGAQAWQAVQKLRDTVRSRLSRRATEALEIIHDGRDDDEARAIVAREVQAVAASDQSFRATLEGLIGEAGTSQQLATVMAIARDNAKQVNIGGSNTGAINF